MIPAAALVLVACCASAGLPPQVHVAQWPASGVDSRRADAIELEIDLVAVDAFSGTLEMTIGDGTGAERETEVVLPVAMIAGARLERAMAIPPAWKCPLLMRWRLRASDGSLPVMGETPLACLESGMPPGPEWLGAFDVPSRMSFFPPSLVLVMRGTDFAQLAPSRRDVLLADVACGRTLVIVRPTSPLPPPLDGEMRREEASCWRGTAGEEVREIAYGLGTLREVDADVQPGDERWPLSAFALGSRARRWMLLDLAPTLARPWFHPRPWVSEELLDAGDWSTPIAAAAAAIGRARRHGAALMASMLLMSLGLVVLARFRGSSRPAMALGGLVLAAPCLTWMVLRHRAVGRMDVDLEVVYHDARGLASVRETTRHAGGSGGPDPTILLCPDERSRITFPDLGLSTLRFELGADGCVSASPIAGLPSARRWVGASMREALPADPAWDADLHWEHGRAVGRVIARRRFDEAILALPPRIVALGAIGAGQSHDVGPMIEAALGGASSELQAEVHAAVQMALERAGDGMPHPLLLIGINHRAPSPGEAPLLVEIQGVDVSGDPAGSASHWGRIVPYSWDGTIDSDGPNYAAVPAGGEARGFALPPERAMDLGSSTAWLRVESDAEVVGDPRDPYWLRVSVPARRRWVLEPGFEVLLRWSAPEAKP